MKWCYYYKYHKINKIFIDGEEYISKKETETTDFNEFINGYIEYNNHINIKQLSLIEIVDYNNYFFVKIKNE